MRNNVYIRSNKSIFTISMMRILFLLPLIAYGFYKNGIFLYLNKYTNIIGMFKPIILILISIFIGGLVNIIYERMIKKNKDKLINVLFTSFHIEYGIILACIMSPNVNILYYSLVVLIVFLISKFLNNRINIMCFAFIIIYIITNVLGDFSYLNAYEVSKTLQLDFVDYLSGLGSGGIASTHIVFIIIALLGNYLTNNNKTTISVVSIITLFILMFIYSTIKGIDLGSLIFTNSIFFAYTYVATDSVTSSYTKYGMMIFGILIGVLTFGLYFVNPILAPYISILIVSLFNNLIDRAAKVLNKNEK